MVLKGCEFAMVVWLFFTIGSRFFSYEWSFLLRFFHGMKSAGSAIDSYRKVSTGSDFDPAKVSGVDNHEPFNKSIVSYNYYKTEYIQ